MDTPFYERLPGEVTILHSIQIPKVPDQKIKFPDGTEKTVAAGATACKNNSYPLPFLLQLIRLHMKFSLALAHLSF